MKRVTVAVLSSSLSPAALSKMLHAGNPEASFGKNLHFWQMKCAATHNNLTSAVTTYLKFYWKHWEQMMPC